MPHVCFFDIDIGYYAPVGLELSYQDTTISAFYVSGVQELGLGEEFLRIPIFFWSVGPRCNSDPWIETYLVYPKTEGNATTAN